MRSKWRNRRTWIIAFCGTLECSLKEYSNIHLIDVSVNATRVEHSGVIKYIEDRGRRSRSLFGLGEDSSEEGTREKMGETRGKRSSLLSMLFTTPDLSDERKRQLSRVRSLPDDDISSSLLLFPTFPKIFSECPLWRRLHAQATHRAIKEKENKRIECHWIVSKNPLREKKTAGRAFSLARNYFETTENDIRMEIYVYKNGWKKDEGEEWMMEVGRSSKWS